MRRVPRSTTSQARPNQAERIRRLPGKWLAAALITGAVALLAPGVGLATAGQPGPATATVARPRRAAGA